MIHACEKCDQWRKGESFDGSSDLFIQPSVWDDWAAILTSKPTNKRSSVSVKGSIIKKIFEPEEEQKSTIGIWSCCILYSLNRSHSILEETGHLTFRKLGCNDSKSKADTFWQWVDCLGRKVIKDQKDVSFLVMKWLFCCFQIHLISLQELNTP